MTEAAATTKPNPSVINGENHRITSCANSASAAQPAVRCTYALPQPEIDKLAADVLEVLRQKRVQNLRITGAELAQIFGYNNDRQVRLAIRALIARGVPVMSSVHAPYGYCLVESREEAEICELTLRKRAIEILERLRDFKRAVQQQYGNSRQLPLFDIDKMIEDLELNVNQQRSQWDKEKTEWHTQNS